MNKNLLIVALAASAVLAYMLVSGNKETAPKDAYRKTDNNTPSQQTQDAPKALAANTDMHSVPAKKSARKNDEKDMDETKRDELEQRYQASNNNSDYPDLESKLREIHQRRPDSPYDTEELVEAMHKDSAWERLEDKPADIDLPEKQKAYDTEFIRFDRAKIETLSVGDTMEIPVVHEGETYLMQVEEVENHGNGNITWRGNFSHEGQRFRVSFTQNNAGLTVGGMNTPSGHYTLEAHNDTGWVMSSDAGLRASSEPDYIVPQYE